MKFATITDRYGVVENQDSCLKLEAIRSDETKCGSPSAGSESLPVARDEFRSFDYMHQRQEDKGRGKRLGFAVPQPGHRPL
jgi:hypothetical protein